MIYECAGILGMDPGPLTLRELVWMAEARQKEAWRQTALLCRQITNAPHMRPRRPAQTDEFDPFSARNRRSAVTVVVKDPSFLAQFS